MDGNQLRNIFSTISRKFRFTEHKESLLYTIVNVFFSFFILLVTILISYAKTQNIDFSPAIQTGDVFIICASMGAASMYGFHIAKRDSKIGLVTTFFILTLFNYAISLTLYFKMNEIGNSESEIKFKSLAVLVTFVINIITVYFSHYYQNLKTNIPESRRDDLNNLKISFDKIS